MNNDVLREHEQVPHLFSRENFREYAKHLAYTHDIGVPSSNLYGQLIQNLKQDKKNLDRVYNIFSQTLLDDKNLLPSSSEWLLDNFFIIIEQLLIVKHGLTQGFYKDLAKLSKGSLRNLPRIYSLAWEILVHSDNNLDIQILKQFILDYEAVTPLTSAEIWALPIILRLILISSLSDLAEQAANTFQTRKKAQELAQSLILYGGNMEKYSHKVLGRYFYGKTKPDTTLLLWLFRSLRDQDARITPAIRWLENYVQQEDLNIEEVVKAENQKQAAKRITVGNIVTSLRLISSISWKDFFEETSLVEKILRQDPSGIYPQMDFDSRDRYRHAVENLSRYTKYNEQEVARRVVKLAQSSKESKFSHVGYYLINNGIYALQKNLNYRPQFSVRITNFISIHPTLWYGISLLLFLAIGQTFLGTFLNFQNLPKWWALLALIPMTVPVVSLINGFVVRLFHPNVLPKLELLHGVGDDKKTLIVIPCLLSSAEEINCLIDQIEKIYFANYEKNIYFGLLTDFVDSRDEITPSDQLMLEQISTGIENLNLKHDLGNQGLFYLLHRPRQYNQQEKIWMGWERKRGKLEELNRLICGSEKTSFSHIVGQLNILKNIRYVITLDADTQMPINTAKKLIGTISHPLNQAVIDPVKRKVTDGYGIIQPRVDIHAPAAVRSLFTRLYASESGLDPYHSLVSNVYQDLFENSVYIGKAIYDVRAFYTCLDQRFPQNRLLSHDLLEGLYLRVAMASDIILLEDFPSSYLSYSNRLHRWIRGDWQIASWIGSKTLDYQDKWKIIDNLRRSLIQPTSLLAIVLGSFLLGRISLGWTGLILAMTFFSHLQIFYKGLVTHSPDSTLRDLAEEIYDDIKTFGFRLTFSVSILPFEAVRNLHAIEAALLRTIFKLKGVLEWTSQAVSERTQKNIFHSFIYLGEPGLFFGAILLWMSPEGIQQILPGFWLISPFIAYWVSRQFHRRTQILNSKQKQWLGKIALRTWRFFDEYANAQNNYLPVDNIQTHPGPTITKRTSPTNIGFFLTSIISAYDMGYINKDTLTAKLSATFESLNKLDRFNGHFYNWYRTDTMQTLHPAYISTADSGNLAACLLVINQACIQIAQETDNPEKLKNSWLEWWDVWIEDWANLSPKLSLTTEDKDLEYAKSPPKNPLLGEAVIKVVKLLESEKKYWSTIELKQFDKYQYRLINLATQIIPWEKRIETVIGKHKVAELYYWRNKIVTTKLISAENEKNNNILRGIAVSANEMVREMDFNFLYAPDKNVFSIGFNVNENKLDDSYYNLLASESRLAGFIAIALKQISEEHWFELGRPLKKIRGKTLLYSWGGTMFEYLMTNLFTKDVENTILTQTNREIVRRQIDYGKSKSVPWGISESGYYALDFDYNYQYQQFGIPDLSLKRELTENIVVSPYSTFLALDYVPKEAFENLRKLTNLGACGTYGFYEAVDYNRDRLPQNTSKRIVRSYMAHHQGMSLAATNNFFNDSILKNRFHHNELVSAVELLLSEKIPRYAAKVILPANNVPALIRNQNIKEQAIIKLSSKTEIFRSMILSNSEYSTVVSNNGTGYSIWKNLDVTRFRFDATENNWGRFSFVKNRNTNETWSTAYQPFLKKPDNYHVYFYPHKCEFVRIDSHIETKTTITVATESNVEIREVALTNRGTSKQVLELTDYAEIVLLPHRDDVAHPAFGKLFVETKYDISRQALLFKRRSRSGHGEQQWYWHTLKTSGVKKPVTEYETDRNNFIGRGNDIFTAKGLATELTNFAGVSLDPIASLRTKTTIKAQETQKFYFISGLAVSRAEAEEQIDRYSDIDEILRAYRLAEIHSQIELRHFNISADQAKTFQKLGSKIVFADRNTGVETQIIEQNSKGQSGLFTYGISGDYPIVLIKINSPDGVKIVRECLLAHEYLRMKNIRFDLIILNNEQSVYASEVKEEVVNIIDTSLSRPFFDKPGGIFLRDSRIMSREDLVLLDTASRLLVDASLGNLENVFDLLPQNDYEYRFFEPNKKDLLPMRKYDTLPKSALISNPWGKFADNGREFHIQPNHGIIPPLPWSNVMANANFGALVTSGTLGNTWADNSQLNKLTSWNNDPTMEKAGEYLFLKKVEENTWWSATPLPDPNRAEYTTIHGFGYTTFRCHTRDFGIETTVWVDETDPIKFISVKITSKQKQPQKLRLVYFTDIVMGENREQNQFFIHTAFDYKSRVLLAKNVYNEQYANRVMFVGSDQPLRSFSADKTEFIGLGGSIHNPKYLNEKSQAHLSNRFGIEMDPAGTIEVEINLEPKQEQTVNFYVGQVRGEINLEDFLNKYVKSTDIHESFLKIVNRWKNRLMKIQIHSPNTSLDTLVNGWLPYQALSGRFWGRTGFYQAGGAIGFRDQIQDCLALLYTEPQLVRNHILLCAEHQFIQGDVMHWWHPSTNRGIRSKVSDDFLWLPWLTHKYLEVTEDKEILNVPIGFMDMAPLREDENDRYDHATPTLEKATLYDHCLRALDNGMKIGSHGLPLMGSGDWNDGLNNIGPKGIGESIWLAFFQYQVYSNFAGVCKDFGDKHNAQQYHKYAKEMSANIDNHGWDKDWYLRAYTDDNVVFGGSENLEGSIDLVSQTWAVISKAGDPERAKHSLDEVENRLVDKKHNLVRLLDPPFDNSQPYPGYIQGYVPGIRENGAQYTHAAVWLPLAYTMTGQADKALEILDMINPINLTSTAHQAFTYKGEPYVLAGDVYTHPQHIGRAGWTWYTGSAAWMYILVIENIFGLKLKGDNLTFQPCVPKSWQNFSLDFHFKDSVYNIEYQNSRDNSCQVKEMFLDGKLVKSKLIKLNDVKKIHQIRLILGDIVS